MSQLANIPRNLACLLWRDNVVPDQWENHLANWCECGVDRARQILSGGKQVSDRELQLIATAAQVDSEQIVFGDLLEGVDIFLENLKFLLNSLEHGGKSRLAAYLSVTPITVYKWKGGEQRPSAKHSEGLLRFFGLDASVNLAVDPLFLVREPIGTQAKKLWLRQKIDAMEEESLSKYFPALKKLLD